MSAVLILPGLLLKVVGLSVPRVISLLAVIGIYAIPIPIALFLIYFNALGIVEISKAVKIVAVGRAIRFLAILVLGNAVAGYALVAAVRSFWVGD